MDIHDDEVNDSIMRQLQEAMKTNPESFTIIEERIDIDLQMEYFKYSTKVKEQKLNELEIIDNFQDLYNPDITIEDKKTMLNRLASLENVEAYRIIEHFYKNPENPVKEWTALALRESKMMIETSLLDEKQILISTGLGGKGSKLRYFMVLISKNDEYDSVQRKLVQSELEFIFKNYDAEIESIVFDRKYSKILSLIPLTVSIKQTLNEAVSECNQYGNFLNENFIVTNVKEFTNEEIDEFIKNSKKQKKELE